MLDRDSGDPFHSLIRRGIPLYLSSRSQNMQPIVAVVVVRLLQRLTLGCLATTNPQRVRRDSEHFALASNSSPFSATSLRFLLAEKVAARRVRRLPVFIKGSQVFARLHTRFLRGSRTQVGISSWTLEIFTTRKHSAWRSQFPFLAVYNGVDFDDFLDLVR